ncbi:MAG: L-serine ammonia-lyase, iron-sulfur-dependent, subunit alpha [Treponema berlinense]|uniref:L-serine ammonia-lyase, iron-sulfur-dependent, subunit alpha n=1 Tax=Treponema berlinense TaxID=225004 RepID=UPI0023F25B4D|nr:L-serine ammonia-lyase, iron-sulfur-dependent, subunit alpha [Treponema berlinense]MDD5835122.1 L-serine ammonia-lyase, iron-sulfur-dependent, subunit alpha [Treponema berlinense]
MSFKSLSEIVEKAKTAKKEFWQIIIKDDMKEQGTSFEVSFEKMKDMYLAMKNADKNYDPALRSASGLSGGDGAKLEEFKKQKNRLLGDFMTEVMEKAVKMGESNACMKRIVAAPTAGSCGIIPAVLLTYEKQCNVSEEKIVQALFVAAGIGEVIAQNACISGAQGGCQAEIGSSSAMAAGALTSLDGGTNDDILNSVALALKSMLGLTCDPVAGLVEVPCIKRNVSGAVNAVVASQMTKAGVKSAIPADEVIDSMGRIGKLIPACLRETGEDGLAATPTGLTIMQKMRQ